MSLELGRWIGLGREGRVGIVVEGESKVILTGSALGRFGRGVLGRN